jgi:hypothetical protein
MYITQSDTVLQNMYAGRTKHIGGQHTACGPRIHKSWFTAVNAFVFLSRIDVAGTACSPHLVSCLS